MMISSLQMFEVAKYKHEFTVEVAEEALSNICVESFCPSVHLWLSLQKWPFEVCIWIQQNTYLHSSAPFLLPPRRLLGSLQMDDNIGVPGLYVLGVGPVSHCSGPGDH